MDHGNISMPKNQEFITSDKQTLMGEIEGGGMTHKLKRDTF